jgi:hypothetical protein
MSENISKNDLPKERDASDRKKEEALDQVFKAGMRLLATDELIFKYFAELLGAVVGKVKEDPGVVFTGRSDNISDLVSALKAAKPEGGVGGGDIVGGAGPSLSDIADFIKAIGDHAEAEKKLLAKLIFAAICGCDCVCKCICD